ncbi:MAG TPA: hypothetical protein VF128_06690 [Gemmatimonadaceae bacterium]
MTEDFFERVAAREKVTADVRIESPTLPVEYTTKYNPWNRAEVRQGDGGPISLICTDWQPGGTYRIRLMNEEIIIHVSKKGFKAGAHTIDEWQNERAVVLTSTASGSCSTVLSAHCVGVQMNGDAVNQWRDALLYFTVVDDAMAWRPEFSICDPIPPGMSWVGPTRELVYGDCGREREPQGLVMSARPLWNLAPGPHDVTMIAWLPGVTTVRATKTVVIACR